MFIFYFLLNEEVRKTIKDNKKKRRLKMKELNGLTIHMTSNAMGFGMSGDSAGQGDDDDDEDEDEDEEDEEESETVYRQREAEAREERQRQLSHAVALDSSESHHIRHKFMSIRDRMPVSYSKFELMYSNVL